MSRHPAATREHHDDFCTEEKWQLVRGAKGKPVQHHRTYELTLWDGRILRTRISKPIDRTTYSVRVWTHILREQLQVRANEFWECVRDHVLPDRGAPQIHTKKEPMPLHLVRSLSKYGVDEGEILELAPAQAAELLAKKMQEFYADPGHDSLR